MDINQIWTVVEPYVMKLIELVFDGTLFFAMYKLIRNRVERKLDMKLFAKQTAKEISGSMVNVDVTAITEKKLDKIHKELSKEVEQMRNEIAAYKHLLALMGGAMSKLKAITQEERLALNEASTALEHDYIPPEPEEVLTVKLEPIATADETPADPANERFL